MKWLIPHFTEDEIAPVEIATRLLHGYLSADAKLLQIFDAPNQIVRLDFVELAAAMVGGTPILIVHPGLVDREPEPGKWSDRIRVRVTLRIEFTAKELASRLPADEPGIATLLNYIVGVCTAPGTRQLVYTPTGKTQERPLATRMETPTVSVEPIEVPGSGGVLLDYYIDLDYHVDLSNNGWQAKQQLAGT